MGIGAPGGSDVVGARCGVDWGVWCGMGGMDGDSDWSGIGVGDLWEEVRGGDEIRGGKNERDGDTSTTRNNGDGGIVVD